MENRVEAGEIDRLIGRLELLQRDVLLPIQIAGVSTDELLRILPDAITALRSLHPAGSGTGREPVAWQTAFHRWVEDTWRNSNPFDVLGGTTVSVGALRQLAAMLVATMPDTSDALPGQGGGLREILAPIFDRLDKSDAAWLKTYGETNDAGTMHVAVTTIRQLRAALSRPQASAPPTPSEEEVEAACSAYLDRDDVFGTVSESAMNAALTAAYAVRCGTGNRRRECVGGPSGPSEGVRTEPPTPRSGPSVAGGEKWLDDAGSDVRAVPPSPAPRENTEDWEVVSGPAWDKMPATPGGDDLAEAVALLRESSSGPAGGLYFQGDLSAWCRRRDALLVRITKGGAK